MRPSNLAKLVGTTAALALSCSYGGERLYVSHDSNRIGWLRDAIGSSLAAVVWQEYKGCYLQIPAGTRSGPKLDDPQLRWARDCQILSLSEVFGVQDLARMFCLSRREVQRILRKMGQQDGTAIPI